MPGLDINSLDIGQIRTIMSVNQDVYQDNPRRKLPDGWKRVFDSKALDGNRDGGFFGALYCKEKQGGQKEWMICFRGYNGRSDVNDLAAIAFDTGLPGQVADACHFTRAALKNYGLSINDVALVGHSMGAYLSKAAGLMLCANRVFAFSGMGLNHADLPRLRKLARDFNENAADVSVRRLDEITTSIYSSADLTPKTGDLHGKALIVAVDKNPHLMKSLEVALLRRLGVKNPYSVSIVPRPKIFGFPNFVKSIGVR